MIRPAMVRVVLPFHLRDLARIDGEVQLVINGEPTLAALLDALEAEYPVLRGTIRDQVTRRRRARVRFFGCEQDLSFDPPDAPLPARILKGEEPLLIVGAISGG